MALRVDLQGLKTLEEKVTRILEAHYDCRVDDGLLYFEVCRGEFPETARMTFLDFINLREELNVPRFESVSRTRRKIQTLRPDLGPSGMSKQGRKEQEEVYKKYAEL